MTGEESSSLLATTMVIGNALYFILSLWDKGKKIEKKMAKLEVVLEKMSYYIGLEFKANKLIVKKKNNAEEKRC